MVYFNHLYGEIGAISLTSKTSNAPIIRHQLSSYDLKVLSGTELRADIAPLAVIMIYSNFTLPLARHANIIKYLLNFYKPSFSK